MPFAFPASSSASSPIHQQARAATSPAARLQRNVAMLGAMTLLALGAAMHSPQAAAAGKAKMANDSIYEQDRQVCMDGRSNQDRATCMREAGAAQQMRREGKLSTDGAPLQKNRLDRCNALPAADQSDCLRRMQDGTTEGTAADGGILRESVTTVPAGSR